MGKIVKLSKRITDAEVKKELKKLLEDYKKIKAKNSNPLIDPRDMLILDYEKAMKAKKFDKAKMHLLTLGLDEKHAEKFIKNNQLIRIIN